MASAADGSDRYVNEKGKGIVPHSEFSVLIKRYSSSTLLEISLCGKSRKKFNALGLRGKSNNGLAISNYQTILKNPIYTGLMRYNGELYEGKHEPIITKKLFDDVQEVMTRKSKPKTKELKSICTADYFIAASADASSRPKHRKATTISAVQSVKVSVHRNMSVRRLSLRRFRWS